MLNVYLQYLASLWLDLACLRLASSAHTLSVESVTVSEEVSTASIRWHAVWWRDTHHTCPHLQHSSDSATLSTGLTTFEI